jgi:hypothetical protein
MLGIFVLAVSIPLAVQFFGPNRLKGSIGGGNIYVTDLLNLVVPTGSQLLSASQARWVTSTYTGNAGEANSYLGVFVIAIAIIAAWRNRKNRLVTWAALTCASLVLLSLGPQLHVGGTKLPVPLPWLLVQHLPLFDNAYPSRLFIWADLAVALLIGVFVQNLLADWRRHRKRAVAAIIALVAAIATVVPAEPFSSTAVSVPPFFTSAALTRAIPPGSVALVAPFTQNSSDDIAMLWQASSEMGFRMPEGYFIDYRNGDRWDGPGTTTYSTVLQAVEWGSQTSVAAGDEGAMKGELENGGISRVVLGPMPHRDVLDKTFREMYGRPVYDDGQVAVWRAV